MIDLLSESVISYVLSKLGSEGKSVGLISANETIELAHNPLILLPSSSTEYCSGITPVSDNVKPNTYPSLSSANPYCWLSFE